MPNILQLKHENGCNQITSMYNKFNYSRQLASWAGKTKGSLCLQIGQELEN